MMAQAFAVSQHRGSTMHPLWHRSDPVVAVTEMDPQFRRLQQIVPLSWMALARAKCTLDSIVSLGRPHIQSSAEYRSRVRSLLDLLARDLDEVARSERSGGSACLARQAGRAAEAIAEYARTNQWPRMPLERPDADGPWLFCGPLKSWSVQEGYASMALLLAEPDPFAQAAVDAVDDRLDLVRGVVARTLGGTLRADFALPEMRAVRLLLAGGISAVGHKNFAHFFPLDAPSSIVEGRDFTVLFSNIQRIRLQRCSLALLSKVAGNALDADLSEVLRASVTWFRGHDIAHFWRLAGEPDGPRHVFGLSDFEQLTLEESLADILGLLSAAELVDTELVSVAFAAEMLRYLSRNYHDYADSAAAVLELGWLERHAELAWRTPRRWLDTALPELAALAPVLQRALMHGCEDSSGQLSEALATGTVAMKCWSHLFTALPSDLGYSFG